MANVIKISKLYYFNSEIKIRNFVLFDFNLAEIKDLYFIDS